ncbi:MAG: HAD family hydrolase [Phycisphaerae bacterium]|nr:HAD family hydrolase [Phycisphaerae bacterium]MDW8261087.1 HAD family hydrolase [Phycisphaerales bacterium]
MQPPRAILFDLDGTLTRPLLDFAQIRAEMGAPAGVGILEWLETADTAHRQRAEQILDRHETTAARQSELSEGCRDLLDWLRSAGVPAGVVTRNSRRCTELVRNKHGLAFAVEMTRDDGVFKPDPAPLRLACGRLGLDCAEVWMVGDGEFDVRAGLAAGCPTIWISHGRQRHFSWTPWITLFNLRELQNLLEAAVSGK